MLFEEQVARKPDLYPWTEEFIETIWSTFWTPRKFHFGADYDQFQSELSAEDRQIIVRTLSAIGQIEIAVKTFWAKLGDNLPHPSIQDLGFVMANSEVVHNRAYEKLLDRLQINDIFEDNLKVPVLAGRVNYLRKYLKRAYGSDKRKQYVYALILFTLFVENVSLFSQFYIVLHYARFRSVLKDTAQQVNYTRHEEGIHAQVGIKIINTLRAEYPELFDAELEERIAAETLEAVKAEGALIDWIMGNFDEGNLSAPILKTYIGSRLNDSLQAIGFKQVAPVDRELLAKTSWMEEETIGNTVTDFFHGEPVEYGKNTKSYSEMDLF